MGNHKRSRSSRYQDERRQHQQNASSTGTADRLAGLQAHLLAIAQQTYGGSSPLARSQLADVARTAAPADVGRAVALLLRALLPRVAAAGWLPVDLHQVIRRRLGEAAAAFILDALASWCAEYASASVDELWQAQLRSLGAHVWWQPARTHFEQWARRNRLELASALDVAVQLISQLVKLPALTLIAPPPGSVNVHPHQARHVDDDLLARVRALLAKAESTEFPHEAEALSAKAQQMMSRYGLSHALLDHHHGLAVDVTTARMWLDNPYVTAKATLVHAVAGANRCRVVYDSGLNVVSIIGEYTDLDATALLSTSLLVQASRAMLAEGSQVDRYGESRTRSFRHAFLISYARRIGERLVEADRVIADDVATHAPNGSAALKPVLAQRNEAVDAAVERDYPRLTSSRTTVGNSEGWAAGAQAADRADLRRGDSCIDIA